MDSHGPPMCGDDAARHTSRDYSLMKQNSGERRRSDGPLSALRPATRSLGDSVDGGSSGSQNSAAVTASGVHHTYSSDDIDDQVLVDVTNHVESPRSEGSGESVEVGGSGVAAVSSLASLDTLELAQLYLQRTRAGSEHSNQHTDVAASGAGVESTAAGGGADLHLKMRTLGDGAEKTDIDLDAIREQLRQRDETLDLAARVGQELLERNAALESDLMSQSSSRDILQQETTQLKHDISVKERLLKMYYSEMEDEDERAETLHRHRSPSHSLHSVHSLQSPGRVCMSPTRSISSMSNVSEEAAQLLQVECEDLRSANKLLAEEAALLHQQAALLDQREQELISECVRRLNEATQSLGEMQQGHREREAVAEQHTSEIAELHDTNRRMKDAHSDLSQEKETLQSELISMASRQSVLSSQVLELQEQYMECLSLFRQAQSELAVYRKHASLPPGVTTTPATPSLPAQARQQSIGSELTHAMRLEKERSASPLLNGRVTPTEGLSAAPAQTLHSADESAQITPTNAASDTSPPSVFDHQSVSAVTSSRDVASTSPAQSRHLPPGGAGESASSVSRLAGSSSRSSLSFHLPTSQGDLPPSMPTTPSSVSSSSSVQSAASTPGLHSRTQHANQIMSAVRSLDSKPTQRTPGGVYHRNRSMGVGPRAAAAVTESPLSSRRQSLADISADLSSTHSLTGDRSAHDMRIFSAPERLRIVKPMEGSLTLLKWKLLALQQQTGADALHQALAMPGVHVKNENDEGGRSSGRSSGSRTPQTVGGDGNAAGSTAAAGFPRTMTAAQTVMPSPRVYRSSLGLGSLSSPATGAAAVTTSTSRNSMTPSSTSSSSPLSAAPGSSSKSLPAAGSSAAVATVTATPAVDSAAAPSSTPALHRSAARTTSIGTPRLPRFPTLGLGGALSGFGAKRGLAAMTGLSPPAARHTTGNAVASATEVDGDDGVE